MAGLWALSTSDMAARVRAGEITSEALTAACLERIAAMEPEIRAWAHLDAEAALAQARARDAAPASGALHGVPVGVKDVIDTSDLPSGYGSEIYDGHQPARDADCVAALRAAGAVILGKTVTTEFATFRPAATRNPRDLSRTPGGSSSGSAAAVACGMAPLALGTQTVGSVIRPASFCGVIGFKPSYGRLSTLGVKPLAPELDTVGCFTRTVADAALWLRAMTGAESAAPHGAPRIGLVRTAHWADAAPETRAAVTQAVERLAKAGAEMLAPDLPPEFDALAAHQDAIFSAGAARALAAEWRDHAARLSPQLLEVLERGAAQTPERLARAREAVQQCRAVLDRLFGSVDLLLAPAAMGAAPDRSLGTGDPLFSRMWTLLHGPCLSLPAGAGPGGLPVGVQLIGARGRDGAFLAACDWCAERLLPGGAAGIAG